MIYHILREIADSWMLLAMFAFFIGAVLWAFRPGSKPTHRDAANVPFKYEDAPASDSGPHSARSKSRAASDTKSDPEGQA